MGLWKILAFVFIGLFIISSVTLYFSVLETKAMYDLAGDTLCWAVCIAEEDYRNYWVEDDGCHCLGPEDSSKSYEVLLSKETGELMPIEK